MNPYDALSAAAKATEAADERQFEALARVVLVVGTKSDEAIGTALMELSVRNSVARDAKAEFLNALGAARAAWESRHG